MTSRRSGSERFLLFLAAAAILGVMSVWFFGRPVLEEKEVLEENSSLKDGVPAWDDIFDKKISPTDPRVLRYLHNYRLFPPPAPTPAQIAGIGKHGKKDLTKLQELINAETPGFFVECGANDGVFFSNTLSLEEDFGWTGLLIEASPSYFEKLAARRRNAWTANVCLSGEIEKNVFKINTDKSEGWMQGTGIIDPGTKYKMPANIDQVSIHGDPGMAMKKFRAEGVVDCFPLHSLLVAIGRRTVDFFSLDVQGHEFQILKVIPWKEVDIRVIMVEYDLAPEGKDAIRSLMEEAGYKLVWDKPYDYTFQKIRD